MTGIVREELHGWSWNECLPDETETLHPFLVSIVSLGRDLYLTCIGTGFIIGSYGQFAVVISAAYNFYGGVFQAQNPQVRHHTSALPEFLPNFENVSIDKKQLRMVHQIGNQTEMCVVGSVMWDKAHDLAIFTVFL